MPFPPIVLVFLSEDAYCEAWNLLRVLCFCRGFSKVEAPYFIHLKIPSSDCLFSSSITVSDLASLPNLRSLDFSACDLDVESAHKLFEILPDFASLTELVLPDVPEITDWGIVAEALTTSKTLGMVTCILSGEVGEDWAKALDAGLCADTALSSVNVTIYGPMSGTALQALENLLLNKSLSSVSVIVKGDMPDSLAVTLSRALAGQTALKILDLRVNGKLSFCGANLVERGIVKNNSLSELKLGLNGELPDNWQAIVENLNVRLTENSTLAFEFTPNTSSQVTPTQLAGFRPCKMKYGFFERERVTLNVWGELTVDGAEALYNLFPCTWSCPLTLNIHGKLSDDFLHCTARHVDKQKPFCPLTINTWEQLTNEGKALFKELELDKNPGVTLNVCDKHAPSDESCDNEIESIDNPESLIVLLEGEENTGKEAINVQGKDPSCVDSDDSTCDDPSCVDSDDSTCDDSDWFLGHSWHDSLGLAVNCTLESLTLTTNNCTPTSTESTFTLISLLERFISLKSLTLTINEYNNWESTYAFLVRKGLERNTSLISLTLTVNLYSRSHDDDYFYFNDLSFDGFVSSISMDSFTLAINDFRSRGHWGDHLSI